MELRDSTQTILHSPKPSALLELADNYIEMFNDLKDAFILPRDHAALRPLIEVFYDDLDGFVAYTKAIRNQLTQSERQDVHLFYRRIATRRLQQTRRDRVERALAQIEKTLKRTLDGDERTRVISKLEQHWGKRRREYLDAHRRKSKHGRLSLDARAEILEVFYREIDEEITRNEIPQFKF